MLKWVWRFHAQSSSFWARTIKAIHGDKGKLDRNPTNCQQSCWLHIVKEISNLKSQGINFMDYVRIHLGNGCIISFWNDHWIGDGLLRDIYPRLFALESNKSVTVNSKLEDENLFTSFRRQPRSGAELTQLNALSDLVTNVNLRPCVDRWVWDLEGSGDFTVASIRREIDDKRLIYVNSKTRWIKAIPIKVNIFAWKVKIDALPTRLNISRRGITLDSIICPICDHGVESTNHLFFECILVGHLTRMISKWWDIPYAEGNSYDSWYAWFTSIRMQSKHKLILEGVFYVTWWHLWTYRNKLIFEPNTPSKATIFDDIVTRSFYWCRYRCKASFSWNEWLKTPYLVTL